MQYYLYSLNSVQCRYNEMNTCLRKHDDASKCGYKLQTLLKGKCSSSDTIFTGEYLNHVCSKYFYAFSFCSMIFRNGLKWYYNTSK